MLGSFNKTVLIVACVLLILGLILIGVFISKNIEKAAYPPVVGDCPDYWIDTSGNGSNCVNLKDLGTCNAIAGEGKHLTMDFSVAPYTGADGLCQKFTWANSCGITWDGITSGVTNPCSPPVPSS